MIDEKILDEILPVPSIDELRDDVLHELSDSGFIITNFNPGGVWYTLLMIVFQIRIELMRLLRVVLSNMFVNHAQGIWLELKAAEFSKKIKKAEKTRGFVTLTRNSPGESVKIAKGHIFKTDRDINGDELRYMATDDTVIQRDEKVATIVVEAENAGARYNVPENQITKSLIHIESGFDIITNERNWIAREGSDMESIDSLKERVGRAWAELARVPIRDTYISTCEQIPGVLFASVNDQHPRGQGTIDIVITGTAGGASDELLDKVSEACEKIKAPYDNLLIKSSKTVAQSISLNISIPKEINSGNVVGQISSALTSLLKISKERNLNELLLADIIYAIKGSSQYIKNVKVILPTDDVILAKDMVVVLGEVSVNLEEL